MILMTTTARTLLRRNRRNAPSAKTRYQEQSRKLRGAIEKLQAKLAQHEADFAASGSRNWGYVGDLDHYNDLLSDIVDEADEGLE